MGKNSRVSSAECIHGLEPEACDLCSPRRVEAAPRASAPRARSAANRSPRASAPVKAAEPAMRVQQATSRRYLVVHRDRLGELLASAPIDDEAGWRPELGEAGAFDPIRWEDAALADRGAELVVLVGSGPDPDHLELVAVANQPARTIVADILREAGRSPRIALNPAWFA